MCFPVYFARGHLHEYEVPEKVGIYIESVSYLENLAPKIFGTIRKHKKYWRINKNTVHLQKHGAIGKTWRTHAKSHHSTKDNK